MATLTWKLQYAKSTKNTHVYKTDADVPIQSVYVERAKLPAEAPKEIELTLKVEAYRGRSQDEGAETRRLNNERSETPHKAHSGGEGIC